MQLSGREIRAERKLCCKSDIAFPHNFMEIPGKLSRNRILNGLIACGASYCLLEIAGDVSDILTKENGTAEI